MLARATPGQAVRMSSHRLRSSILAEVLAANPGLAHDLFVDVQLVVESYDGLREMLRPAMPGLRAADGDIARLRSSIGIIKQRLIAAIELRSLIDATRAEDEASLESRDLALTRSAREFANSITGRVILELPPRARLDGGPLFDTVEIAPLSPPDENGVIESLESLEDLQPEQRASVRWALFGHTPGQGCQSIGDFDSAFAVLEAVRRLFGDVRHQRWPAEA